MSNAILKAKDLHKKYVSGHKTIKAVDGVSFEIKRGNSIAIVGPSGAGKSTLLHMLGGLDRPSSGEVILDDMSIYKMSDKERSRVRNARIGFVFQFYHLLPELTALENVMLPALIKGHRVIGSLGHSVNIKEKAFNLLKNVGLKDRADHKPSELSGGESQRVAIARSLINQPEILLCDEPTGNLDSKNSHAIYELLMDVKSKSEMALVIVTHDEKISQKTDDAIHIRDGKSC